MTFNVGDYVVLTGSEWVRYPYDAERKNDPCTGDVVRISSVEYGVSYFDYGTCHSDVDTTDEWGGVLLSDVLKPGVRVEYRVPSRANEFAWGTYEGLCSLDGEGCRFVLIDGRHQNSQGFRRVDLDSVPKPDPEPCDNDCDCLEPCTGDDNGTKYTFVDSDGTEYPLSDVVVEPYTFKVNFKNPEFWDKLFFPDPEPTTDAISPDHYQFGDAQVIDITRHLPFPEGNVVKYVSRAGRKGDRLEDLLKARKYLDWAIENAEESDDGLD